MSSRIIEASDKGIVLIMHWAPDRGFGFWMAQYSRTRANEHLMSAYGTPQPAAVRARQAAGARTAAI